MYANFLQIFSVWRRFVFYLKRVVGHVKKIYFTETNNHVAYKNYNTYKIKVLRVIAKRNKIILNTRT
jgi:hypothetical protein